MSTPLEFELTELRQMWQARREAMREILRRFDTRGMRRPARNPAERGWLEATNQSWFVEDEACAKAAQAYYERKYRR